MSANINTFVTQSAMDVLNAIRASIKTRDEFSATEIGATVGRSGKVIAPYLHRLSDLDEIHCAPGKGSALVWRDGPRPLIQMTEDDADAGNDRNWTPTRRMVAAQQIGMQRCPLVAALFGEPQRAAA